MSETATHQTVSPRGVLVLDDEEIVRVALRDTLVRAGYEVTAVGDPVDAVEILQKNLFAAIISDHFMPRMTGLEFLGRAKTIQPDAARILITAVLSLDTVIEAINKGEIYRFIVKPWLREELLATVKDAVQRYELICRNTLLQATTLAMNEKLAQLNREMEAQVQRAADQNQQLGRLNRALEQNLQRSIGLCLKTMETFYPTLGSQARRVFEVCRAMAADLQMPPEERQVLEVSSWLYDIGLVGVPRHIIRKWQAQTEALNEPERTLIEQHPILGQELAGFVQNLEAVGTVIRGHHERFDGQGYPDRLVRDQIPWLGRLLAVAVGYAEAVGSGLEAITGIRAGSGSMYDPEAVRVFVRALPAATIPRKEREVLLSELRPGMVLARGIYTSGGLLLIPEGQQLSELYIDKLQNHNQVDPITQTLMVFC